MAVATTASVIRTLHRIQRQLTDLRSQLAAGPKQISVQTKRLQNVENEKSALAETLKQARKHSDEKQLLLRSSEAKINELEAKRNTAKANREYQLLGEQIDADKMAIRVLEDEILESLERVDEITSQQPAATDNVKKVTAALEELKKQVQKRATQLEGEMARVLSKLAEVESELAVETREVYQRVVKHKGEDGMASSEGGCCGGCHQKLTGKMLSQLMAEDVAMCRSCGRLLYEAETNS
jgi:predicted  nucleic acid-binding Zn-ribbon protein